MDFNKTLYLLPGALYTEREACMVTTVLGSCVALCLYDRVLMYGAINHFMLPYWSGQGLASPRYGDIAIERMISNMKINGSKQNNLVAKLFGGAAVLEVDHSSMQIGQRNIQIAQEMVATLGIPIVSHNLGGVFGRKIIYDSATGAVFHKFLGENSKKQI
jgi:chemotaxis protein CheD